MIGQALEPVTRVGEGVTPPRCGLRVEDQRFSTKSTFDQEQCPGIMSLTNIVGWCLPLIASGLWLLVVAVFFSDIGVTGASLLTGWIMMVAIPATVLAVVLPRLTRRVDRHRGD